MKTPLRYLLISTLSTICLICSKPDGVAADQPHMRSAIELLQSAKKASNPLPDLNAAREQLAQKAKHNKKGERLEALEQVRDAIAEARAGNREKMVQKIDHAIVEIHSGMDKAK